MIPAAFDYVRADSADDAIALLGEHGDDAKLLAGGHSLLPLMKLRLATPSVLIDVGRLSDLSYIRDDGDHIAIGALTRHRDVETRECCAAARAAAGRRPPATSAIRRSATAARSAARSPTATRPPTCRPSSSRSGATLVVTGPGGERADRRRRVLHRASSRPRSLPTSSSPRSACPRCPAPGGRSRSSTVGPRTGPSSASPSVAPTTAPPASGSSTWARRRCGRPASSRPLAGGRRCGRRRRRRRRRHRTAAPTSTPRPSTAATRSRARPPGARGGRGLLSRRSRRRGRPRRRLARPRTGTWPTRAWRRLSSSLCACTGRCCSRARPGVGKTEVAKVWPAGPAAS